MCRVPRSDPPISIKGAIRTAMQLLHPTPTPLPRRSRAGIDGPDAARAQAHLSWFGLYPHRGKSDRPGMWRNHRRHECPDGGVGVIPDPPAGDEKAAIEGHRADGDGLETQPNLAALLSTPLQPDSVSARIPLCYNHGGWTRANVYERLSKEALATIAASRRNPVRGRKVR